MPQRLRLRNLFAIYLAAFGLFVGTTFALSAFRQDFAPAKFTTCNRQFIIEHSCLAFVLAPVSYVGAIAEFL